MSVVLFLAEQEQDFLGLCDEHPNWVSKWIGNNPQHFHSLADDHPNLIWTWLENNPQQCHDYVASTPHGKGFIRALHEKFSHHFVALDHTNKQPLLTHVSNGVNCLC